MLIDVPRRRNGRPTLTTAKVRGALQSLVEGQLENIDTWLRQTANGTPKVDRDGKIVRDKEGSVVYTVKPDPAQAVKLVADLAEFVIPRLSRSEATVVAQVEQVQRIEDVPTDVLKQRLMSSLGLTAEDAEVVMPVLKPEGD